MAAVFEKKKLLEQAALWLCGVVRSSLPFYSPFMKGSCQPISCPAGRTSWTASLETEEAGARRGGNTKCGGLFSSATTATGITWEMVA